MFSKLFFFTFPRTLLIFCLLLIKLSLVPKELEVAFSILVKLGKGMCEALDFCVTIHQKKSQELGCDNS